MSLTIEIRIVGISARLEEEARQVEVSVLRGQVERRELVGVVLVNLGASVDQVLRHLGAGISMSFEEKKHFSKAVRTFGASQFPMSIC